MATNAKSTPGVQKIQKVATQWNIINSMATFKKMIKWPHSVHSRLIALLNCGKAEYNLVEELKRQTPGSTCYINKGI